MFVSYFVTYVHSVQFPYKWHGIINESQTTGKTPTFKIISVSERAERARPIFAFLHSKPAISFMAAKLPLLQHCEAVSFYKYVTKRTKWTTKMSLLIKWTSVNRIWSVLRLYAVFINMQVSGQICKVMAIHVEIPFLLIISVKKEQLKFLFQCNEQLWIGLGQLWGLSGMQYSLICKLVVKYTN